MPAIVEGLLSSFLGVLFTVRNMQMVLAHSLVLLSSYPLLLCKKVLIWGIDFKLLESPDDLLFSSPVDSKT